MSKKIDIEDLYVEDIVKDMARGMNTLYIEKGNITQFDIPETLGIGNISATQFASGMGIINLNYQLNQEMVIKMEKNKINPLKFIFNLGEPFYHKFDDEDDYEIIEKYSGAIIGSSPKRVHSVKVPKNHKIHAFSLEINRNLFNHKIENFNFDLGEELTSLLKDVRADDPFLYRYPFGAEEFEMIQKIIKNDKSGFIGSLYKEGITYTILSNTLETYVGQNCENYYKSLEEKEIDLILEISEYIESNLGELPTIEEIASKSFVAENKLQKLFKSYYGCSVHDFIRNKRLDLARDLLENSNLSISEISDNLGIRSKSYFSKIFKERYGVTPSEYRGSRLSKIRFF